MKPLKHVFVVGVMDLWPIQANIGYAPPINSAKDGIITELDFSITQRRSGPLAYQKACQVINNLRDTQGLFRGDLADGFVR